jgi:hypothetical protein
MIRTFLFFILLLSARWTSAVGYIEQPRGTVGVTGNPSSLVASIITYAIGLAAILGVIGITW